MNKHYYSFIGLLASIIVSAQIGINTISPQATLQVKESDAENLGVQRQTDPVAQRPNQSVQATPTHSQLAYACLDCQAEPILNRQRSRPTNGSRFADGSPPQPGSAWQSRHAYANCECIGVA